MILGVGIAGSLLIGEGTGTVSIEAEGGANYQSNAFSACAADVVEGCGIILDSLVSNFFLLICRRYCIYEEKEGCGLEGVI